MSYEQECVISQDYRSSHLATGKGESYDREFVENPHLSMMWEFEKRILDRVVGELLAEDGIKHLDFACGTARILAYFEGRASVSVGIDVSPSMLGVARRRLVRSQVLEADITREDVLGDQVFNLITAFRFFPNAEPELRKDALQVLVKHLSPDGCLIFNNHKNLHSLRNRLARMCRRGGRDGMAMAEIEDLIQRSGMKTVRLYHLCVLPASERRLLLPQCILRPVESVLSCFPLLRGLGQNVIYVCKHIDI